MGLKPGYKQTEVGVIPEDWDLKYIENLAYITTGSRNTQDRVNDGLYPFFVRSQTIECINSYSFDGEAVLTAGDGVGTGKVFHYINGRFDAHQRVYRISDFNSLINGYFFFLYFSNHFYSRIMQMTAKSSVDSVRREMIARMPIPLPPKMAEQEAIAEALSDADALIESLEQFLAKKRHLKQGAMQELLTGKKRLPGFSDEWKAKRLLEVCRLIVDGTHFTPHYVDSGVAFYSVENLTANDFVNTKFISRTAHIELSKRYRVERGDILLTRIGSIGDTKLIDWDVDASIYVSLALLKTNEDIDARYLHCYSKSRQFIRDLEDRSLMNASPKKINMGEIGEVPIIMPSLDEQVAIATVLSDMDTEIATLETKLTKARQLKQGMMQELLTGRIRLVST
jgi:type I restriction enzyme S subunit